MIDPDAVLIRRRTLEQLLARHPEAEELEAVESEFLAGAEWMRPGRYPDLTGIGRALPWSAS